MNGAALKISARGATPYGADSKLSGARLGDAYRSDPGERGALRPEGELTPKRVLASS